MVRGAEFKSDIYEYLEALPTTTFQRLFLKPATCLAIFRLLPSLARQFVMAMLYVKQPIPIQQLSRWVVVEAAKKRSDSLAKLAKLHVVTEKNGMLVMDETFRLQFQNALTGGGTDQSFGLPCSSADKHKVDIEFLDNYANQQWSAILHFMVGTTTSKRPSKGVLKLMRRSGLMADSEGSSGQRITHKGFQFLLQDVNTQVWAFLLQYLDMAENLDMDLVEVLNFFFQLGSLELGRDYSVETLTPTQRQMLEDLRDYGIVYQRKGSSRRYYPTRLATTLTTGSTPFVNGKGVGPHDDSAAGSGKATTELEADAGFLILETNYRLYAYTDSTLVISILNLFTSLKTRFPNMVAGMITRDSVRSALSKGITADQIIAYLTTHAHSQMRKKSPVLPPTVVDQIRLWEMELNRMQSTPGYLYQQFNTRADYELVVKYASDLGVLRWSSAKLRMFVVTVEGHEMVKAFIKRRMKPTGNGTATATASPAPS
ncbi:uncharacterized protein VTP21DRAFT_7434 [Calcarisporiella thermophila]|uniref:uncharacterized protein n=1 Tax=Calcarisporiella thermophila TaxID=911321 RepID=UPI0037425F59